MLKLKGILLLFLLGINSVENSWSEIEEQKVNLLGIFYGSANNESDETIDIHSAAMFHAALVIGKEDNLRIDGEPIGSISFFSGGDEISSLRETCRLISSKRIAGIVGPPLSRESQTLSDFSKEIGVPVISYSATDPNLSDRFRFPSFYRTVPSDREAALAVAKLFDRFDWSSCVLIHQNDALGSGGAKVLSEIFFSFGLKIEKFLVFDLISEKILGKWIFDLMSTRSRIVLVWAISSASFRIVEQAALNDLLGPNFLWIFSSTFSLNKFNESFYSKLQGILFLEPISSHVVNAPINRTLLDRAMKIWQKNEPKTFVPFSRLDFYSLFSFDATWTLLNALVSHCSTFRNEKNNLTCLEKIDSNFCFDRKIFRSKSIFQKLDQTDFLGVSGRIHFRPESTDRIDAGYYAIFNIQPTWTNLTLVRVLDFGVDRQWSDNFTGNVIVWPGNILSPPTGRALLTGIVLRIVVVEMRPFTTSLYDGTFFGYIPDLIEHLKIQLNFSTEIILAAGNQTYSGLVRAVANSQYDLFMGDVTVTASRRERVAFSAPIFDNSLRLVMRKSFSSTIDLLSFLKPLSLNLWCTYLASCFSAGLFLCFIERRVNEALRHRSFISQLSMSVWYSFGNIVGYGADFDVETAAGRLLTMGLYIISLIFIASYTANLVSVLTTTKLNVEVKGIQDVRSGKIPFHRIGVTVGSAIEDYFLREVSDGVKSYFPLESVEEGVSRLLDHQIDALITDNSVGEYLINNVFCNLTLVGERFAESTFSVVVSKDWLYLEDLDRAILKLKEEGTLLTLQKKWFKEKVCRDPVAAPTPLTVESMLGLFLTFSVISFVSIGLSLRSKYRRRTPNIRRF